MATTTVTTSTLLQEIEQYWSRRASSYSDLINTELATDGLDRWLPVLRENGIGDAPCRILDVGTGPGFFAIALASLGHQVVAVDYREVITCGDAKEVIQHTEAPYTKQLLDSVLTVR